MSYYFVAIGGSGAKVMESLTHLCAAGLLPKDEKLYVMAVDPDTGNGNLSRSSTALHCLEVFQKFNVGKNTPLLKTPVELASPFVWNPTEQGKCLDDVMAYQAYKGTEIGSLYEVLYTKKERATLLDEGFRGHPSIGAAVIAKKIVSDEGKDEEEPWKRFVSLVNLDAKTGSVARIFLAGSVFGGTGAAGMPTIAKLLQQKFSDLYTEGKVLLGGALILPYFSFTPSKEDRRKSGLFASSENFLTNTQAALKYYAAKNKEENIYHAMYFIGDNILSPVDKFSVGAATQENDAHIVDLYGALAAIDFYMSETKHLKKCSYITHAEDNKIQWSDIPNAADIDSNDKASPVNIKERFAQFARFIFSYLHLVKPVLKDLASGKIKDYPYPWFIDYLKGVDVDTQEVKNFEDYAECFVRWIKQLEKQKREITLIDPAVISSVDPPRINADLLAQCAGEEDSGVTINELWFRLCEGGIENGGSDDFGRFLRALYISCEKR